MQKQGLQTKDPKSYGKEVPKGAQRVPWEPQESEQERQRAPEVSREAPPEEYMSEESSPVVTGREKRLRLRLTGHCRWKFKDNLETRNALVPKGTVADIYIYIYIYI